MSRVRVGVAPEFRGETVIPVVMDRAGLEVLLAALAVAEQHRLSEFDAGEVRQEFVVEEGAAYVDVRDDLVKWRLPAEKLTEILDSLAGMRDVAGPSHQYVDIDGPVPTLVLSCGEYVSEVQ